jgi:hypothetical protein
LERLSSRSPRGQLGLEYNRISQGKEHIKKLVICAGQLVELSGYQIMAQELFNGGNVEDYLAYFQRNNLRFAPAAPNHRGAYYKVFNMMVRYYLDQKAAAKLDQQLSTEIADLKSVDKDADNMVLGKTMTAADQAAIQIERLKFVRALIAN